MTISEWSETVGNSGLSPDTSQRYRPPVSSTAGARVTLEPLELDC